MQPHQMHVERRCPIVVWLHRLSRPQKLEFGAHLPTQQLLNPSTSRPQPSQPSTSHGRVDPINTHRTARLRFRSTDCIQSAAIAISHSVLGCRTSDTILYIVRSNTCWTGALHSNRALNSPTWFRKTNIHMISLSLIETGSIWFTTQDDLVP